MAQGVKGTHDTDKPSKYGWFAVVLYPDNPEHMDVLRYLEEFPLSYPKCVYILHDKDVWTAEDEQEDAAHVAGTAKKPHIHVMFKVPKQGTVNGVIRSFAGVIDYVEGITSPDAYIEYMTHSDFKSRKQGKVVYDPITFRGSRDLIIKAFNKTVILFNCVAELTQVANESGSLTSLVEYISGVDATLQEQYLDTLRMYSSFLLGVHHESMSNRNNYVNRGAK